jgi:hypothetical protein
LPVPNAPSASNDALFGPRWYALSPERVVDDIEHLVNTWV